MQMKISAICVTLVLALLLVGNATAGVLFDYGGLTTSTSTASPAGSTWPLGIGALGAVGGMDGGPISFTMAASDTFSLTIIDCCLVGDIYQAFVDGTSLGFTSIVPLGGPTNSTGTFSVELSAGSHTFDVNNTLLTYLNQTDPYGGGTVPGEYSPAGFEAIGTETPEPGTFVLLGIGLLGAAGMMRRRKA